MSIKKQNVFLKDACGFVGSQTKLASLLGVACSTVNQWLYGVRPIPSKHCPEIEKITEGQIVCESLRPDIDWAYLRNASLKAIDTKSTQKNNSKEAA